ncbi:MAG: hypothetical protein A2X94_17390 [Bdellovibrionales bacterium GWB1_55_8]|nr:MAG: hypothetical protein A2X94_17390 [Bdellovibrionales bacterium GWB1_55_8]
MMNLQQARLWIVLLSLISPYLNGLAIASGSALKADENLVFFTTTATLSADGSKWTIPVRGRVYEPETDSLTNMALVALIRKATGITKDSPEHEWLAKRAGHFTIDNQSGKTISIRVGERSFKMSKSNGDGLFSGTVELPAQEATLLAPKGILPIRYDSDSKVSDQRTFAGSAVLTPPQGISIISDIDDTVKITQVRDHKEMLANTFLRPFREAPGMSTLYQRIAESRPDARFHFVSGSPWQLYEPLQELFRETKFPNASFHLKEVSFDGTTIGNLFMDPEEFKIPEITGLFDKYPARKFILIGDSGEKDPEVYAEIFKRYPNRVAGIFIRNVTDEPRSAPRYQQLFGKLPADKWSIFTAPAVIQSSLDGLLAAIPTGANQVCCGDDPAPIKPTHLMNAVQELSR